MPNPSGVWNLSQQAQAAGQGLWPSAPGAPTITSASAGNTNATVAFSAPSFLGVPATITGYQAISTPGCFTASGSASPLTITGLTNGTAYTIRVRAQNAIGYGPYSDPSGSVTPAIPIEFATTTPGSYTYVTTGTTRTYEVVVIGGGGAGSNPGQGGGGGGGGYFRGRFTAASGQTISYTVGSGGQSSSNPGASGSNSTVTFGALSATAGAGGGANSTTGGSAGSVSSSGSWSCVLSRVGGAGGNGFTSYGTGGGGAAGGGVGGSTVSNGGVGGAGGRPGKDICCGCTGGAKGCNTSRSCWPGSSGGGRAAYPLAGGGGGGNGTVGCANGAQGGAGGGTGGVWTTASGISGSNGVNNGSAALGGSGGAWGGGGGGGRCTYGPPGYGASGIFALRSV